MAPSFIHLLWKGGRVNSTQNSTTGKRISIPFYTMDRGFLQTQQIYCSGLPSGTHCRTVEEHIHSDMLPLQQTGMVYQPLTTYWTIISWLSWGVKHQETFNPLALTFNTPLETLPSSVLDLFILGSILIILAVFHTGIYSHHPMPLQSCYSPQPRVPRLPIGGIKTSLLCGLRISPKLAPLCAPARCANHDSGGLGQRHNPRCAALIPGCLDRDTRNSGSK